MAKDTLYKVDPAQLAKGHVVVYQYGDVTRVCNLDNATQQELQDIKAVDPGHPFIVVDNGSKVSSSPAAGS